MKENNDVGLIELLTRKETSVKLSKEAGLLASKEAKLSDNSLQTRAQNVVWLDMLIRTL